jgi:hypothetical protein
LPNVLTCFGEIDCAGLAGQTQLGQLMECRVFCFSAFSVSMLKLCQRKQFAPSFHSHDDSRMPRARRIG